MMLLWQKKVVYVLVGHTIKNNWLLVNACAEASAARGVLCNYHRGRLVGHFQWKWMWGWSFTTPLAVKIAKELYAVSLSRAEVEMAKAGCPAHVNYWQRVQKTAPELPLSALCGDGNVICLCRVSVYSSSRQGFFRSCTSQHVPCHLQWWVFSGFVGAWLSGCWPAAAAWRCCCAKASTARENADHHHLSCWEWRKYPW